MKKNQLIGIILASIGLSMAVVGSSQASQGIYVSGDIGTNKLAPLSYFNPAHDKFLSLTHKPGLVVGAAVGYQWDNYRIEGAFDHINSRVKKATMDADSLRSTNDSGKIRTSATMVNALYDLDALSEWTTYLGLGLGQVNVAHRIDIDSKNSSHSSISKFAYQGILGASYRLSEFVRTNLDYRYLRSAPSTYQVMDASVLVPMKGKYKNHRVTLSLTAFL